MSTGEPPEQSEALLRAPPPRAAASAPRPVSQPGSARVSYLTDEQKEALNRKYGTIKRPSAAELRDVVTSGADCKMQ